MAKRIFSGFEKMEEDETMSIFDSELIQDQLTACVIMDKITAQDGYGGYVTTWQEGAPFDAIITENGSLEASIAAVEQSTTFYGVKTARAVPLEYHTAFKRLKDGKTFRIKDSEGLKTPSFSAMDMKQLQAEEFELVVT